MASHATSNTARRKETHFMPGDSVGLRTGGPSHANVQFMSSGSPMRARRRAQSGCSPKYCAGISNAATGGKLPAG